MERTGDPIRGLLGGLLVLAGGLYFFLPRPATDALDPATGRRKTVVTVMGGHIERDRQMWQALEREFERDRPDLDLKVLRGAGEARKVDTMIAGGVAPDVLQVEFDKLYYYVEADALLDLAAFVARDPQLQRDVDGYTDDSGTHYPPDFFEFTVQAFRERGRLLALPMWYLNFFVYYNKTLFDRYNVPYPDEDWDWQGFRERAIALTRDAQGRPIRIPKRDAEGRVVADARGWTVYAKNPDADDTPYEYGLWFATWQYGPENFVRQNGGRLLVNLGTAAERVDVCSPPVAEAFWFLYELGIVQGCLPRQLVSQSTETTIPFRSGRIGILGPEAVFRMIDSRDQLRTFEWDVAPLPKGPGGIRASLAKPFGLAIAKQCPHPEAAFAFVQWFTGPRGATVLSQRPLFVPPRRSFALSEKHFLDPATVPDSDWAMVHDVSFPYTDPQTGAARTGYTFLPEAASVRHQDVYDAINKGIEAIFYYRNPTDDQFKAFQTEHHRSPTDDEALVLHRRALAQGLADVQRGTERAYRWAERHARGSSSPRGAWQLWLPLALTAAFMTGWAACCVRRSTVRLGALERRQQAWGYLLISPWLLGFVALTAGPILFSIGLSFCKWQSLTRLRDAEFVGVENYVRALSGDDPLFYQSLKATLQYSLVSVPLLVLGGLALALLLNARLRLTKFWRTFYFVPSVLPLVAVVVLYFYLFDPAKGWVNHTLRWLGWSDPPHWPVSAEPLLGIPAAMWMFITMSLWTIGGSMIIYLGSLQGIPTQLYEAAQVDGASRLRRFWHVTLPMISPVLFFMLIMGIIGSFQVFTNAYVFFETEGGPRDCTLFYVLHLFNEAVTRYRFGYAAALSWILFAIILVLTALVFKSSPMWVYYAGSRERGRR